MTQATAVEILVHALEYLADSTLEAQRPAPVALSAAMDILTAKSREIFAAS